MWSSRRMCLFTVTRHDRLLAAVTSLRCNLRAICGLRLPTSRELTRSPLFVFVLDCSTVCGVTSGSYVGRGIGYVCIGPAGVTKSKTHKKKSLKHSKTRQVKVGQMSSRIPDAGLISNWCRSSVPVCFLKLRYLPHLKMLFWCHYETFIKT